MLFYGTAVVFESKTLVWSFFFFSLCFILKAKSRTPLKNIRIHRVVLELTSGDIAQQPDCDAIVNAANAQLRTGGGVAGAIHGAGDPELEQETKKYAPIRPGEAVITSAPHLPNKHIIHCLGPVYGRDEPGDILLKNCYANAIKLAEKHRLESIAFPAISTGAFGYPMKDAAQIAFSTIKELAPELQHVRHVRFVLWKPADFNLHWDVLKEL